MSKCYLDSGSPDSTEEMKNLESRQAAVTLLQIKNYDPLKYIVKTEDDHQIIFNSVPSLPPSQRAREVMHCNAVIDIISKAVAQRESEEARNLENNYELTDRTSVNDEKNHKEDYVDEQYSRYNTSSHARSPVIEESESKEMDLSYGSIKNDNIEQDADQNTYFSTPTKQNDSTNFPANHRPQISVRQFSKIKFDKEDSATYEECSQSSSDTDPERLQMDISQMSQVYDFFFLKKKSLIIAHIHFHFVTPKNSCLMFIYTYNFIFTMTHTYTYDSSFFTQFLRRRSDSIQEYENISPLLFSVKNTPIFFAFQDDPEETQSARSTQSSPQPMHDENDKESLWQALHRQNGKLS